MNSKKIIVIGNGSNIYEKENGHKIDSFDYVVRMGNCCINGFEKYVGTKTDMYRVQWQNLLHYNENLKRYMPRTTHINFKDLLFTSVYHDTYAEFLSNGSNKRSYVFNKNIVSEELLNGMGLRNYSDENRMLHDILLKYFVFKFNIKNIFFIQRTCMLQAYKEVNTPPKSSRIVIPSNGILTVFFLFNMFPNNEIYITGFDGFKTRYYWTTAVETSFRSHDSVREQLLLKKLLKQGRVIAL